MSRLLEKMTPPSRLNFINNIELDRIESYVEPEVFEYLVSLEREDGTWSGRHSYRCTWKNGDPYGCRIEFEEDYTDVIVYQRIGHAYKDHISFTFYSSGKLDMKWLDWESLVHRELEEGPAYIRLNIQDEVVVGRFYLKNRLVPIEKAVEQVDEKYKADILLWL